MLRVHDPRIDADIQQDQVISISGGTGRLHRAMKLHNVPLILNTLSS